MQKKILVPFLILLCFHCAGQVKFLEGTVILADGKLSTGFIEYRDWTKNPSRINFRETKTGTTVSYAATEITQFEIPNVCKYRSAQVDIDPNPVTTEAITGVRMPSAKGTFLLKVLVEGEKVTLYEFVDSKPHFFISYEKEPVTELVYALVMDPASGNVFTVNDFRGQIKNIPGITLSEKQLQRIIIGKRRSLLWHKAQ